jgi:HEPN superfamily AbiU2-like protein
MTTDEREFDRELELFRTECEGAAQLFFGYLAIHEVAKRRRTVYQLLSENALFWNTAAGAMQTAAIIAIGRIFDQGSPHNYRQSVALGTEQSSDVLSRISWSQKAERRRKRSALARAASRLRLCKTRARAEARVPLLRLAVAKSYHLIIRVLIDGIILFAK